MDNHAKKYFISKGLEDRIIEFSVSSATVELAAAAIGCKPEHIAKSITFKTETAVILIVAAGDGKIDNTKYKAIFHTKAKMLTPEEVLEVIGYPVGGVCPFGINPDVKVYLDESLKRFTTVYAACGAPNMVVGLSPRELEENTIAPEWIDVCKGWQED